MPYKVVFVEDEIVTREGVRDNVDWSGHGFEFSGEAADGEIALPLVQAARPDVLITDIKMPFMDGLQLCRIVRQDFPWVKIVILSGHDEFEYAQQAIKLGVAEYLLKPVTAADLHSVLDRIRAQLDEERRERETLRQLRSQVEENRATLVQQFLLEVAVGAISPAEAIARSRDLRVELIANCYGVVVIRIETGDPADPLTYQDYRQVQRAVAAFAEDDPEVLLLRKDLEDIVLIVRGESPESVQVKVAFLGEHVRRQAARTHHRLTIATGGVRQRLSDIHQSFFEALAGLQETSGRMVGHAGGRIDKAELLKINRSAIENYLKCGMAEDFDEFFDTFIRPLGETALRSYVVRNYILMDIVLVAARFVSNLGCDVDQIIPNVNDIQATLASVGTVEQLREQAQQVLLGALACRDRQVGGQHVLLLQRATDYIEHRYADPDISLGQVAAHVNFSPCHFSTVFSQETGTTFKEYLTELRIRKAKELLRGTMLKSSEIADLVGYSDPHYFSYVFRKRTGLSPKEYRLGSNPLLS